MQAIQKLPEGYQPVFSLDLEKNMRAAVWLNGIAFLLFIGFGLAFTAMSILINPGYWEGGGQGMLFDLSIFGVLAALVIMVVAHEGVHGLFFWVYTGARPVFGLKALYAYAAAPDWYLPRNQYLVVGSSPFVAITLIGLLVIRIASAEIMPSLLFLLSLNAGGAAGDFFMLWKVAARSRNALVNDQGGSLTVFEHAGAV